MAAVAALVMAVSQAEVLLSLPLPLPRFSTFCSAARGTATAKPKREERMMVERMAMRTCEGLRGEKLLDGVVVLTR